MYRKVEESQTLLINHQSKLMEENNQTVYKFGFGQSPFLPPDYVINELKKQAHRKEYTSVQGLLSLREAISDFHRKANKIESKADNIFIAPGSKILLYSILACFEKADIILPQPSWVSYEPQTKLLNHNPIRLKSSFKNRWRVTPEIIREAFKTKKYKETIMILNYPGNPDGLSYTKEEIKEIASVAKELDIVIIADEIYGLLTCDNHDSFANYYPEKTITTTGLSKWCGAGGWRLGVAILSEGMATETFKKTLVGVGSETYSCAPTPIQLAAIKAYEDYHKIEPYILEQRAILKQVGTYCFQELKESRIQLYKPEGGFYLFPDFSNFKEKLSQRGIHTSNDLCETLLKEAQVALLPGSAFGVSEEELVARLAYVDLEDPLKINESFVLEKHAPRIIEGIQRIKKWLLEL
ncbi:aspartate transaminase [Flavobacteriaceae bacterium UJ101]|nr:aspartate transaminase [Flavobacteriaceae bacterium UJ101]